MIARICRGGARCALVLMLLQLLTPFAYAQTSPDAQVIDGISLRLRAAPSLDAPILSMLEPRTPLTVLGLSSDRDWLQVETVNAEGTSTLGWVYREYVDLNLDLDAAFPEGAASIRLPDPVVTHIRQLYAVGQQRGNRANVFAKVGDSITVSILTLNPIGEGLYKLADYGYLQDVIDFYTPALTRNGHNSFNEETVAAAIGWTTYRVLDPEEGDPDLCASDELPLLCEYRLIQPSVSLIMFGTNDVSVLIPEHFRFNLGKIVDLTEAQGIIPILTTIPVREGYEDRVPQFNAIIVGVAQQHALPWVDYGGAMLALGADGLDLDGAHPSIPPKGYTGAADFSTPNLRYGYVLRNLTALQMLDAVWRTTAGSADQ